MNIGERIKELRKKYKYKAGDFAEKIGVSRTFLHYIETDKKNPSIETLKKICEVLEISMSEFYEEISKKKTIGEQLDEFLKINGINTSKLSVENQKRIAEKFAELYIIYSDKKD